MIRRQNQSGFTLIELLVVIAIIGMLSSILLTAVSQTRVKARDARRKADVAQFIKAIELYYLVNNSYPCSGPGCSLAWAHSDNAAQWSPLETSMSSVMSRLPRDPSQGVNGDVMNTGSYGYAYFSANWGGCAAGQWYIIVYKLENLNITSPGGYDCSGGFYDYRYSGTNGNNITIVGKAER